MRVLIVGCGYVGLPLAAALFSAGHSVTGLRRTAEHFDALRAAGVEPLQADVTRPETLPPIDRPFDWIVNTVAAGGGGAEGYRAVYLEGTRNLLRWLAGTPPNRYAYTSSSSVYGQNDGSEVTEFSPTEPESGTGRVLVEAERLLLDAARHSGFPAIILRVSGIYGPGRGYWFKQFQSGEARIEGNGSRILNMVHRDDVVGAIVAALERGKPGEVYNVTDNEPVTQMEFFRSLAELTGRALPATISEPASVTRRGVTNKRISNQKLRCELGYELRYPDFRAGWRAMGCS